jgi:hypothetical protein
MCSASIRAENINLKNAFQPTTVDAGAAGDLFGMPRLDLIRRGNDKKRRRKEKDG